MSFLPGGGERPSREPFAAWNGPEPSARVVPVSGHVNIGESSKNVKVLIGHDARKLWLPWNETRGRNCRRAGLRSVAGDLHLLNRSTILSGSSTGVDRGRLEADFEGRGDRGGSASLHNPYCFRLPSAVGIARAHGLSTREALAPPGREGQFDSPGKVAGDGPGRSPDLKVRPRPASAGGACRRRRRRGRRRPSSKWRARGCR